MAHGKNAEKDGHAGKEYWASRLHKGGEVPGKYTKKRTARLEREFPREVFEALEEMGKDFPDPVVPEDDDL